MNNNRQVLALGLVAVQFMLLGALAFSLLLLPPDQVLWLRLLGLAAALAGVAIATFAILTHLRVNRALVSISPAPNPQLQLVESGPYCCVRHPIYLGVMLTAGGAGARPPGGAGYRAAAGALFRRQSALRGKLAGARVPGLRCLPRAHRAFPARAAAASRDKVISHPSCADICYWRRPRRRGYRVR